MPKIRKYQKKFEKNLSILIFRMLMISFVKTYWRPKLINAGKLPKTGPCFFYGNHSNRWDPFILNRFMPFWDPTGGIMTREFFRGHFLRWALGSLDIHPTQKRISEPHLIRELFRMLGKGRKIVIYPEGGSRWTGCPDPWIETTAKIFIRGGAPVYPVVMHGSYASWPRWATYPRPGKVEVEILDPIKFEKTTPLAEALSVLKTSMDFEGWKTPDHLKPKWAYKPAHGIHKLLYRDPNTGKRDVIYSPDGTKVMSRDSDLDLKMLPDSMMLDAHTGERFSCAGLYQKVRTFPLGSGHGGALISNHVNLHIETEFPSLKSYGAVSVKLFADTIQVKGDSYEGEISLEKLLSVDIERNYKLQLYLEDGMLQFSFIKGGSALAWKDALLQLNENLQP